MSNHYSQLDNEEKDLNIKIGKYKKWAKRFIVLAFVPPVILFVVNLFLDEYVTLEMTGTYVGGWSGPVASLGGVILVYVAFLGQQRQIIHQRRDFVLNQQELVETRKELEGQKKQLELQTAQFATQSFEQTFFKLVDQFKANSKSYAEPNSKSGIIQLIDSVKKHWMDNIKNKEELNNEMIYIIDLFIKGYAEIFEHPIFKLHSIVLSVVAVLEHISHSSLGDKRHYYKQILRNQLSVHEVRAIYYYLFVYDSILDNYGKLLLYDFLKDFEKRHLLDPSHKDWLMNDWNVFFSYLENRNL